MGLQGQDLGIERQRLGLQGQGLDITPQQEQQQADIARRGAWSGATARGATNTSGFRQGLGDISQNLQNQLAQLSLGRQGLGLSGQGLDIQGQRLGIEGQQQDISNRLSEGGLADQMAQLGLSGQQAQNTLQNELGQAGINQATGDVNSLFGQLAGLTGAAAGAPGFAGQAFGIGGQVTPTPAPVGAPPPNQSPLAPGRTRQS